MRRMGRRVGVVVGEGGEAYVIGKDGLDVGVEDIQLTVKPWTEITMFSCLHIL